MAATVLTCGRIAADVRIAMPGGGGSSNVSLLVDTGAEASALPFVNMPAAVQGAGASHPITFHVAGTTVYTMRLNGPVAETEVEPHSRGVVTVQKAPPNIRVHFSAIGVAPFNGFDGLLGMDMLDYFSADPVKDAAGTAAYLAQRT
jgi:hypothetical protein